MSQPGLSQPSFQPAAPRDGGRNQSWPGGQSWPDGDRTERMDRINDRLPDAAAYAGRSADNVQWPNGWGQAPAPSQGYRTAADDPLTSKAYSRESLTDTDGRSYRAAHRAPVSADRYDAALNENTQTFSVSGQHAAQPQAQAAADYPARGQQPYQPQLPELAPPDLPGGPAGSPVSATHGPGDFTTGSYPYPDQPYPARAASAQPRDEDRYGRAGAARQADQGSGYNGGGYNGSGYGGPGYDTGYGDPRRDGGRY